MASKSNSHQIKLLYVINHIDWFWSHRLALAEAAQKAGYDVHLAVNNAKNDKNLKKIGLKPYEIRKFSHIFNGFIVIFQLFWLISRERIQIIHGITLKYCFICAILSVFYQKRQFVYTIAGLGYVFSGDSRKARTLRLFLSPIFKIIFKMKNARLIFQNPHDRDVFIKNSFAHPDQCHLILGSGVNLDQFVSSPVPHNEPPVVLMPSRLLHAKGVGVFIEAAKILHEKSTDAKFQIAGDISTTNPLAIKRNEMQTMLADGPVEWLGHVVDMPALFARSDIIAYPSYYCEGLPKVLLEAAATGRAIITTDHPGCREAVIEEKNGLLIPIKDPAALAKGIEILLADKNHREKMGQESRKLAQRFFDVKLIVKQTLAVYTAGHD